MTMTLLPRIATLAPLLISALALPFATPLAAQDKPGDRVNMVIAYDESECPPPEEGVITICEILVESERYRIPSNLRTSSSPENVAWAERVESIRYIGDFGTLSCDPAGAGGFTGCNQKLIDQAYGERDESENVRFAQLIEEARQERLATIDAEAAAEQQRVEAIEREYLERLERERDAPLPGDEGAVPPAPAVGPPAEDEAPSY
jgi:hypothetical protein